MEGRIIKGIAGFYYVHCINEQVYECKAKGIFRKEKQKPLVGDRVEIEILDEENKLGNICAIAERTNQLVRPAVANIDQALVIFAIKDPNPNLNLLDRFLISMEKENLPVKICFNKVDLVQVEEIQNIRNTYEKVGYPICFVSTKEEQSLDTLKSWLHGKTTTVAGPSGVGKSSIINMLQKDVFMETGEVSTKIQRGKHTTRHAQLILLKKDTYIVDTPGFSSLNVECKDALEISEYYIEFAQYEQQCKFNGCSHTHEPQCGIKNGVERGEISQERYNNYVQLYHECKEKRRY